MEMGLGDEEAWKEKVFVNVFPALTPLIQLTLSPQFIPLLASVSPVRATEPLSQPVNVSGPSPEGFLGQLESK